MTTFSESTCKELANVPADHLGNRLVVNEKVELCGAFINNMNVTLVNYTRSTWRKKFNFDLFDPTKSRSKKSRTIFRYFTLTMFLRDLIHCRSKRVSGNPELMEQLSKNRSLVLGGL